MPELDPMELRALRAEVALEKGISARHAARLVGNSREELLADADQLRTDLNLGDGGQQSGGQQQAVGFDHGRQGGTPRATRGGHDEAVKRYGDEAVARGVESPGRKRQLPSTAIPTG